MAMEATRAEPPAEATPADPSREPTSERRPAWETLRERDLEEKMGQGAKHGGAVKLFVDVLTALRDEQQRHAYVGWDVFVEWDPNDPRARVSPDTFLLDGQPPSIAPSLWRTWEPGCDPPSFALEIVSKKSRAKDYDQNPMRYSALGAEELAVFDPDPRGEEAFPLQLFRRSPRGQFLRAYAGPGPAESKVLGAWLVVEEGGARVRLARDAAGKDLVLTAEERVSAAEGRATTAEEELAVARDRATAAEARVRELEAMVAERVVPGGQEPLRGE
jgi:Uma2 family endonuclease